MPSRNLITKSKLRKIFEIISIFVCLFAIAPSFVQGDEWPSGGYGLPKPKTGCPGGKKNGWHEGWRFQDMEDRLKSSSSQSRVSNGIHMDVTIIGNEKNVYRTFCMKQNTGTVTRYWPKGSYCIYKGTDQPCPRGMDTGWVKWDDEDFANKNKKGGWLPDGIYDKNTMIHYCCQTAGHWYDSIELPVSRPFYLLTSSSTALPKCQMVKWAFSYLEYIGFDTNYLNNKDDQEGKHVFVDGRKLYYYCYYEVSDCRRRMTGRTGSFKSHQAAVSEMDRRSQYCSWLITVAETHVVSLSFKELTIPSCDDTFLKIYDGLNDAASLLGIYCGANASTQVNHTSSANNLYIVSNSGSYGRNPRNLFSFQAQYFAENIPTISTSQNIPGSEVKGGTEESSSRTIIIVATTMGAGLLLCIVLIVLLVKLKRRKRPPKLSTPVDIPLRAVETSPEILPIDQEPGYETVGSVYEDVGPNASNHEHASAGGVDVAVPPSGNRASGYEIPGQYEELKISPQNPVYTELDKNRRKNSKGDGDYQKLQKRDSDYVIPAHERREPYEDIKMGRNLPGYAELDQSEVSTLLTRS